MNFNSLEFAIFLPIVFAAYWGLPHKFRWALLLLASYYFYMSWNPRYIVLILLTTWVSYAAALLLEKYRNTAARKCILVSSLAVIFGVLLFFKYFNFLSNSIVSVLSAFAIHLHPVTLDLLLPVGISFYTFQTVSYIVDVYRGGVQPEHRFGVYATFISFFPQLVAGPIERTSNLLPQIISKKEFDCDLALYGARQILWGFFKKIAVADILAVYVDSTYSDLQSSSGVDICFAILFFTIQIYCDFSGYSDIAIGTAKLFGIRLMKNFSSPYFSKSVTEFWSRWHISLTSWFHDYLYMPLAMADTERLTGGRLRHLPAPLCHLFVFLCSGLWHGAAWNYVVWGGLNGLYIIFGSATRKARKRLWRRCGIDRTKPLWRVESCVCTFTLVALSLVFFRARGIRQALLLFQCLFSGLGDLSTYVHTNTGPDLAAALYAMIVMAVVGVFDWLSLKYDVLKKLGETNKYIRLGVEYLLLLCIWDAWYSSVGENPFVYFQF